MHRGERTTDLRPTRLSKLLEMKGRTVEALLLLLLLLLFGGGGGGGVKITGGGGGVKITVVVVGGVKITVSVLCDSCWPAALTF